ncbi:MAG: hypothetical protein KatS3mg107_0287 [Gemmataceae bacterium]|nr:MAG: hypothetical protein KatS3mg107_0287 [Gemmataceae bacterium]
MISVEGKAAMLYPSGRWEGFWEQRPFGRQPMQEFELHFQANGEVVGRGYDIVGLFTMRGEWDPSSGQVKIVKHYLGKHDVVYRGQPDGEGCIIGTWWIGADCSGPFLLRPVLRRPPQQEPIQEWKQSQ